MLLRAKYFIAVLLLGFYQTLFAAAVIEQVDVTASTWNTANPIVATITATGTTNTCLFMMTAFDGLVRTVTAVADSGSNTWTQQEDLTAADSEYVAIWSAPQTSSSTTVSVTGSAGSNTTIDIVVIEISGVDCSSISSNQTETSSTTTHNSGTVTAETDGAMIGTFCGNAPTPTPPGSPWVDDLSSPSDAECEMGHRLVASGGSLQYTVTTSSARSGAIAVLEVGPAAAGGLTIPIVVDSFRRRR